MKVGVLSAVFVAIALMAPTPWAVGTDLDDAQPPTATLKTKFKAASVRKGVRKRARGVRLAMDIAMRTQPSEPFSSLVGATILLPRGIEFNGADYPTCSRSILEREQSDRGCPPRSIMGRSASSFFCGELPSANCLDVIFVNGGPRRVWAFATLYNPALVQEPIAIKVVPLRHHRWAYRLAFAMPPILRVVAGVRIQNLRWLINLGGQSYAKRYVTLQRRCPRSGSLPYRVTGIRLHEDQSTTELRTAGRMRCGHRRPRAVGTR